MLCDARGSKNHAYFAWRFIGIVGIDRFVFTATWLVSLTRTEDSRSAQCYTMYSSWQQLPDEDEEDEDEDESSCWLLSPECE